MHPKHYITQSSDTLTLEQRLHNIENFRITDFRSIESHIRNTASCSLKDYFSSKELCNHFIDIIEAASLLRFTPEDSYSSAAIMIHYLFYIEDFSCAVKLLLIFLRPIVQIYTKYRNYPFHTLLTIPEIRPYMISLEDYNHVLAEMFPDSDQLETRHANSFQYSKECLAEILCNETDRLWDYEKTVLNLPDPPLIWVNWIDWDHTPNQIRESYELLKQLFIDPYYNLWYKERGPAKPISPNPLYP